MMLKTVIVRVKSGEIIMSLYRLRLHGHWSFETLALFHRVYAYEVTRLVVICSYVK